MGFSPFFVLILHFRGYSLLLCVRFFFSRFFFINFFINKANNNVKCAPWIKPRSNTTRIRCKQTDIIFNLVRKFIPIMCYTVVCGALHTATVWHLSFHEMNRSLPNGFSAFFSFFFTKNFSLENPNDYNNPEKKTSIFRLSDLYRCLPFASLSM